MAHMLSKNSYPVLKIFENCWPGKMKSTSSILVYNSLTFFKSVRLFK